MSPRRAFRSSSVSWSLGLALSLGGVPAAFGLTLEYALDRAPALVACDRQAYRGERAAALICFQALIGSSEDPRIKADAARAIGDLRGANGFFQEALKAYPEDAALRARWGELFLATHQDNEAVKLFQEALELNPKYAPAKIGLAKISAGRFEEKAREWVNEVIEDTPDSSLEAHLLLAQMSLEDGAIDEGDAQLDAALGLAEKQDLPLLDVYALKASVDLLRGIDAEASPWTKRALEHNAGFGDIYATPAHFYVITRRYREAIELLKRAVAIQPDLYSAHAELGVNLLRENKIAEAQQHLAIAYRGDPFSAPIVNTLRLIDSFDNFVVLTHASADNPGVILRLQKDEAPVLEPYVLDLVRRSIETYTQRYGFELEEPVVVELYPEHDDFAVRTSGLPGIGLLGVTFGYLVAMDSPSGRADADFHWGTTLWHEMAHVFTLEATGHLVPRWFSEGVSVYEEWSTGPLAGRHMPLPIFEAIKEDKLLPVAELDRGFIRPSYESQVIVSYMQAGLICEYIAQRWGQTALESMLKLYAQGKDTAAAVRGALEISPEQFDSEFAGYVDGEFGALVGRLETWQEAQQQAHDAAGRGDWEDAVEAADRAMALYPDYVDEGSAYLVKARAHLELEQADPMMMALTEYHRRGGHDPDALMQLAGALARAERNADAIEVFDDLLMVAPLRQEVHAQFGDLLLAAGRADRAVPEYQASLAMKPHDQAAAHYRLANAYFRLMDRDRSREHLLYALEIAPHYREAQQLLLEIVR
ncbi:MAG TPA: tetratricopeptide repeat protein [Gammaproteobacteria bacterium]|nr:tetratricopeptide repeat protein [Gammaproteobacteria bacterium]